MFFCCENGRNVLNCWIIYLGDGVNLMVFRATPPAGVDYSGLLVTKHGFIPVPVVPSESSISNQDLVQSGTSQGEWYCAQFDVNEPHLSCQDKVFADEEETVSEGRVEMHSRQGTFNRHSGLLAGYSSVDGPIRVHQRMPLCCPCDGRCGDPREGHKIWM